MNSSNKGAIYVLAALVIPVILIIAAGSFAFLSETANRERVEGSIRLVLLGIAERYYATSCAVDTRNPNGGQTDLATCHQTKLQAALVRAQELIAKNSKALGSLQISTSGNNTPGNSILTAGRYYFAHLEGTEDVCPNSIYPCFKSLNVGTEIANAFKLQGTVNRSSLLDAVFGLFGQQFSKKERKFELKVAAIPMRMCAVIDISASIGYDTHKRNVAYSAYPLKGTINGGVTSYSLVNDYTNMWNAMPPDRNNPPNSGPTPDHYQSDYSAIEPYDDGERGYLDYANDFSTEVGLHPVPPTELTNCVNDGSVCCKNGICRRDPQNINNVIQPPPRYNTDLYRSVTYKGPEPWLSIIKGVRMAVETIKNRSVAGDRACLILYNDVLDWRHIVNLTDNFDYLLEILDADSIANAPLPPPNSWLSDNKNQSKWAQLGIFPVPGRNTYTSIALQEATNQFSDDKFKVPSVDFVVNFGDGLPNCYVNDQNNIICNAQQYEAYRRAMLQIQNIIYNGFFKSKTALHMFMTGDSVGPHTVLRPSESEDAGANDCMSEEYARTQKPPIDFVIGQGLNIKDGSDPNGQTLFSAAFQSTPQSFYQANLDWYRLVRLTGGRWAPLRKNPAQCTPITDCAGVSEPTRLLQDPECRDTATQVQDQLKEVLSESAGFVVVQ